MRRPIKYALRSLLLAATVATVLPLTAAASSAADVTPAQLMQAGWTCIQPRTNPTQLICAPPGVGLPPLPGTPGFADRLPSYHFLVFDFATGAFLGTSINLRPDIYEAGQPPCPTQPGGQFIYIPRNDTWFCFRPAG
jgi:hypothetical protein